LFDQLVEDIQVRLLKKDVQLSYSLRQGERGNCLDSAIREMRPQLLALGRHSRGELSSALLGSLTRQFLEQPPCDVLVARGVTPDLRPCARPVRRRVPSPSTTSLRRPLATSCPGDVASAESPATFISCGPRHSTATLR